MMNGTQLISQAAQFRRFMDILPAWRMLPSLCSLPFEYLFGNGRASSPWVVNYLVTGRCNLRCVMCNFASKERFREELGLGEIRDFLRRERGQSFHLSLSGGEPFVREDLPEMLEEIHSAGRDFSICTNGVLLDRDKIRLLERLSPRFMLISLHGDRDLHDAVTGVPGSFDRLRENLLLLSSTRIRIIINCVINRLNARSLDGLPGVLRGVRVDLLRFENLNFVTAEQERAHRAECLKSFGSDIGLNFPRDEMADGKEWAACVRKTARAMAGWPVRAALKPVMSDREIDSWYSPAARPRRSCFFIWRSLFVLPDGSAHPCQFMLYPLGNIRESRLDSMWNSGRCRAFRRRLRRSLLPGCARCCKL